MHRKTGEGTFLVEDRAKPSLDMLFCADYLRSASNFKIIQDSSFSSSFLISFIFNFPLFFLTCVEEDRRKEIRTVRGESQIREPGFCINPPEGEIGAGSVRSQGEASCNLL